MPQLKNSDGTIAKMCPVRSFENYIVLDKKQKFLWQKPKQKIPKQGLPWYIPQKVGHNTHEKFMSNLSKDAKLSQHYTNHCIRVSGVTNLSRANFSAKQVMAASGHKSVELLAIYQCVHEDKKMMMGLCLTYSLIQPQNVKFPEIQQSPMQQIALPSPQPTPAMAMISPPMEKPKEVIPMEKALVPYEQNPTETEEFDLLEFISEVNNKVSDEDLILVATQSEATLPPTPQSPCNR